MFKINENYLKLPGSYLFSAIAKKVVAYEEANPDRQVIRLGIGDVTLPIAPAIVEAIHKAADEMGQAKTFHGYAPDLGYAFLRETIWSEKGLTGYGAGHVEADEIFVSDGAKSDMRQYPGDIQRGQPHCGVRPCVSRVCGFQCHGGPYRAAMTLTRACGAM